MVEVRDPDGREWRVARRVFRRPRWRGRPDLPGLADVGPVDVGHGGVADIVIVVALGLALLLAVVFVFPLVVFLVELLLAVGLMGVRRLLGRYTVTAESDRERWTWEVRRRSRAKAVAAAAARSLAAGSEVPGRGFFETLASDAPLDEAELAHVERGNVRVLE